MALLSLNNISKSFIDRQILDCISFHLEEGDKIGLIGLNGSGKTTLMKILSGHLSSDTGEIFIQKNLKIGYLSQLTQINLNSTIYEQCLLVFKDLEEMENRIREIESLMSLHKEEASSLDELMKEYSKLQESFEKNGGYSYHSLIRGVLIGLSFKEEEFNVETSTLSGGQKARLALAKLLLENPQILLLDEPTNHLDIDAISWLEKFLKDFKGALIVISHDRYFLNSFVNKILLLENHNTTLFKGDYKVYVKERKKQLEQLKKQYEDQQKEIKRQEEIIKRFLNMGRDRFIKQGQSRRKLLDKMKLVDAPHHQKSSTFTFTPQIQSGKDILTVENLGMKYGEKSIFENLNFNIYRGDKVGLIGGNGVGKSTLMKIILGALTPKEGRIKTGTKVEVGYFDQEMASLNNDNTLIDEIWDSYPKLNQFEIRSYLAKFMFVGDDIFKFIEDLSGGEKGRVSLLKLMLSNSNFLLMDEPTNHLDIDSKEVLEDALIDYGGTLLVISHDRYFLNRLCNKIFYMDRSGIREYNGNYDYYLEKSKEDEEDEDASLKPTKTQSQQQKRLQREQSRDHKLFRQQLETLENEIFQLEHSIAEIDAQLSKPEIYENYEKVQELTDERTKNQTTLEQKYEMWIDLS